MSKAIKKGFPKPNRGNVVKNLKRIQANEALLSKLRNA